VKSHARASSWGSDSTRGAVASSRAAVALSALVLGALLLTPAFASAAVPAHAPRGAFGPTAQPSFTEAAGMAVDQSSGDLLVIEFEEVAANGFKGVLSRYHEDGTPANFSALSSTNKIDGHPGEADATPQEEILATFTELPNALEVQVAVDNSGGPNDGDIYVTNGGNGAIDIFAPSGEYIGQLDEFKEGPQAEGSLTPIAETCGVAVDPSGNVYVGDFSGFIHKYEPAANPAEDTDSSANFEFEANCSIAAGAGPTEGFIFPTHFEGAAAKIDSEGAEEGEEKYEVNPGEANATVSVNPANGHLFTATLEEVKEFDASGASNATEISSTPVPSQVRGVALDGPSGNLYVTRSGYPQVEVFDLGRPEFALQINETGPGEAQCEVNDGGSFEPCGPFPRNFESGTKLKLQGVPDPHAVFDGWENATGSAGGVCTGTSPCEFEIEAETTLDAPFAAIMHTLTVEAGPNGKVDAEGPPAPVSGEISACEEAAGECAATYEAGKTVTLKATPASGKVAEWESGCDAVPTPNECEVEIQDGSDSTVAVSFKAANPREVSVESSGEGKVSAEASPTPEAGEISECQEEAPQGECNATYSEGQTVTLVAASGVHHHVNWSGCTPVVGQPSKCKVTLGGSDVNVGAAFVLTEFKLAVTKPGAGSGTVTGGSTLRPSTINCGTGAGCEHEYVEGEEVTLTAAAGPGSAFTGWTGCSSEPSATECKVTMSAAKNVSATFKPEFKLAVTKPGAGSGTVTGGSTLRPSTINCGSGSGCEHEYVEAEEVTLTAAAGPGSAFTGWTGCSSEPSATECKLTMSAAKNVSAIFKPEFRLGITKSGAGSGTVTGGSTLRPSTINCGTGTGCEHNYAEGEVVTLKASETAGSAFTGWTGCTPVSGHSDECEVTISAAKGVTATFKTELKLTVVKAGTGSGTVTGGSTLRPSTINCGSGSGCEHLYVQGELVTLSAAPDAHNQVAWTGCASATGSSCEVTLSAAKKVTATFSPITHTLTIDKSGSGSGSIACNGAPCNPSYNEGTSVTLGASADSGSSFAGWSGGGCSGTGGCTVAIGADTSVTATFNANPAPPAPAPAPAPTPNPTPAPTPKPFKCKKGFKKKKVHGKAKCVKVKKHGHKRKGH